MLVNRRFSARALRGPSCALFILLAVACGGEDKGRPAGDPFVLPKTVPADDCAVEAALAVRDLLPEGDFERTLASGWSGSTDGSPQPLSSPGPIATGCPRDSAFDCCLYGGPQASTSDICINGGLQDNRFDACMYGSDYWGKYDETLWLESLDIASLTPTEQFLVDQMLAGDVLTPDQQARVRSEQALEKTYKCLAASPMSSPGLFCDAIGSTPTPQAISPAIPCIYATPNTKALHVRAARYTDWGAQIYRTYSAPFDASQYHGISFWVRLGEGGTQPVGRSLFIVFDDEFTKESQAKYELNINACTGESFKLTEACAVASASDCSNFALTPDCYVLDANGNKVLDYALKPDGSKTPVMVAYSDTTPASNCYDVAVDTLKCDRFGAGVGLEKEWRFVKIPFTSMRQRGYGVVSPAGRLLTEALLSFGIYMDIGNWDFWIDKIAFYKDPPDTSAP